jgi:hypothetical protein
LQERKFNMLLSKILRVIFWGLFLFVLMFTLGVPAMSMYVITEFSPESIFGELLAKVAFTGFFVIVAFEYFNLRYKCSSKERLSPAFIGMSALMPITYFMVSIIGAHSTISLQLLFYVIWFVFIFFAGLLIPGNFIGAKIPKFIGLFLSVGLLILLSISTFWTLIYSNYVMPNNLELTPYFMAGSGALSWASLLVLLLFTENKIINAKP